MKDRKRPETAGKLIISKARFATAEDGPLIAALWIAFR